ncbi:BnaA04g13430D [Brassica napus]|uniref:BnaA04g13430D protein n=1 Tax=Brassica napus TaxID=3708 RepID=A0A078HLZ6_BRANA|nr:BnaA04g13430D [Brassica napus]
MCAALRKKKRDKRGIWMFEPSVGGLVFEHRSL